MFKRFIIIFILSISSIVAAQSNFETPFKLGSYYEYLYEETFTSIRYSARIVSEEKINGKIYKRMDIYNEPPFNVHTLYFCFDTLTLNLYGTDVAFSCPDSTGNLLQIGFNMPLGFVWNDCRPGAYFRSRIDFKTQLIEFLGSTDTLLYVVRKDTVGGTVEGNTYYGYAEKFGYVSFYREYGSPLLGGPYSKTMVGAIIDGVSYGSILLDVTQTSDKIPKDYNLEQNYPNPFNPSTVIKFSLPQASFVTLKIYNQLGKEISTLVSEKKSSGTYQYVFNANNIPSGIYYYTLQSNGYSETKKMILLK